MRIQQTEPFVICWIIYVYSVPCSNILKYSFCAKKLQNNSCFRTFFFTFLSQKKCSYIIGMGKQTRGDKDLVPTFYFHIQALRNILKNLLILIFFSHLFQCNNVNGSLFSGYNYFGKRPQTKSISHQFNKICYARC